MCGRFTLAAEMDQLELEFEGVQFPTQFAARYNVAPTQPVLAIPNDGRSAAEFFLWGLIPSWSKDPTIGSRLINARGETLGEKPAFRGSYKYKRCLIPADGFYEWQSQTGTKTKVPHYIRVKDRKVFAFAGLWSEWQSPEGGTLRTCSIITTEPNALMAHIHNRMPVILRREDYPIWLDPAPRTPDSLGHLIKAYSAEQMEAYPVSTLVNSPNYDKADLIRPV